MWQRRLTGHAVAATKVAIAFSCYYRTWISIFNRSMCLNSENFLMVVLQVEGSYFYGKKRLSVNSRGGDDAVIIFGTSGLGVFGGGI